MTSPKSFGVARALTAIGALLVVASLPMTWYHADRVVHSELTGWGIFTNLRIWLVVAAVIALGSTLLRESRPAVLLRAVVGLLAGAPVLRRILSPPDSSVALHDRIGLYVALLGALAMIVASVVSATREAADALGVDLGPLAGPSRPQLGAAEPVPRRSGPVAHGSTRAAEPIVDAEVVEEA